MERLDDNETIYKPLLCFDLFLTLANFHGLVDDEVAENLHKV